jgi:hypothetical protein
MATVIEVGGVDITDDVYYARSEFIAMVNGQPGTCKITLKDDARVKSFTVGARILLTIDGLNVWAGYLMRVRRTFPFSYHSPAQMRQFELLGVDINILLSKRWVYQQSNPRNDGPMYPANTADTTVLADLFSTWLDLSGDDLDTSTHVTNVGDMNEDQKAAPIHPGMPWAETLRVLSSNLSPVYYINPDRQFVWADVDVETAPWILTDHAIASVSGSVVGDPPEDLIRISSLTITKDATAMYNDVIFMGASPGSGTMVTKRLTDAASVAAHGTWQTGGLVSGIYKQNTLNRYANAVVYGSPESHRGHKDDKVYASCVSYQNGLRVGMVVRVRSAVWGYDDTLPIRQMRISWEVPSQPKYELLLSHDYDTLSFFDPYKIPTGSTNTYVPDPDIPEIKDPPPGGDCGITDTFNRPDGPLGTSDSGLVWVYEWDDGRLLILGGQMTHQQADSGSQAATLMFSFPLPVHASFDLDLSGYPGGHVYASMTCNDYIVATVSIDQTFLGGGLYTTFITATLTDGSSTASSVGQVSDIPALGPVVIDLTADTLTASFDGVTVSANRSSAAPPLPAITSAADWRMELLGQSSQIKVDNLDIIGVNDCGFLPPGTCHPDYSVDLGGFTVYEMLGAGDTAVGDSSGLTLNMHTNDRALLYTEAVQASSRHIRASVVVPTLQSDSLAQVNVGFYGSGDSGKVNDHATAGITVTEYSGVYYIHGTAGSYGGVGPEVTEWGPGTTLEMHVEIAPDYSWLNIDIWDPANPNGTHIGGQGTSVWPISGIAGVSVLASGVSPVDGSLVVHYNWIEITEDGFCPPGVSGSGLPYATSGRVTEWFLGGSATYQLANPCNPLSLIVYINGITLTGATVDSSSLVTLPFTPVGTDTVLISYLIAGF